MQDYDFLKDALNDGIIDIDTIRSILEMQQRKKYLEQHTYKKWKGSDGYWRTYLPDAQKGRVMKKRKCEKDIDQLIIDYWQEQVENPTIREVFNEWNDRRLELKKISKSTHLRNIQYFERHYQVLGKREIKSVLPEEFMEFLEEQPAKHNLSSKAFSNLKSITKAFLIRAKKRKLINYGIEDIFLQLDVSDNEFKKVVKEDYEEVFNEEEMRLIMNYLQMHPDSKNLGIILMFITGIRIGELVALKPDTLCDGFVRIRRTERKYLGEDGKYVYEVKEAPKSNAGNRDVPIPNAYMEIYQRIKELNPSGEYVFVNSQGKRMTTNCFRRRLGRICEKLHIYKKSPHKIRKTYGTILMDNNLDQRLVCEMMGHTNIMCSEQYYHRDMRTQKKKAEIINSLPEFSHKN